MNIRPRRNRKSAVVRDMVRETLVPVHSLITPIFVLPDQNRTEAIASMPGISRLGLDNMLAEMDACMELGLHSFILFPVVPDEWKDQKATYGSRADSFYQQALSLAKSRFPDACLITDVAMDPYSSDGHDGLVENGEILNDESLPILCEMAVAQAQAGADIIGPSDMMDGRVGAIRAALDQAAYQQVSIMSYTAKYASAFYGPFRDALDSAPKFGDKKTYQMDPANRMEALREAQLDIEEGADFLMVKPAMAYMDVIRLLKDHTELPIVSYQVSGEYAMVKAAAQNSWLEEDAIVSELLTSLRRAGSDLIISYFAKQYAEMMK